MAFMIKIYEKDEYIYTLLKKRLGYFFPDAYIANPYIDEQDYEDAFSSYTRVLYDPEIISEEEIKQLSPSPIRLTEDSGIIDCSRLISLIRSEEDTVSRIKPVSGSLYAVIPFVYSEVRDVFLTNIHKSLSNADFNIRLDFTSKQRALWRGSSGANMTSLLETCASRKFMPEDILKYCNMDDTGFLTPGCCRNSDDVYDLGITRSVRLMNLAADLAHSDKRFINVLAVIEGFRSKDLPEMLCSCDNAYVLLPERDSGEDLGSRELVSNLTKTLGRERIEVLYAEDTIEKHLFNETFSHGENAV